MKRFVAQASGLHAQHDDAVKHERLAQRLQADETLEGNVDARELGSVGLRALSCELAELRRAQPRRKRRLGVRLLGLQLCHTARLAARLEALTRSDANAQRLRAQAERLAMRSLVAAVRALGGAQGLRERRERQRARAACQATTSQLEAEEERERLEVAPPPAMTQPAGFWSGVAYEEEAGASLVSTAKSLDDLLASSSDLPTVRAQMPHGLADDLFEDGSESI